MSLHAAILQYGASCAFSLCKSIRERERATNRECEMLSPRASLRRGCCIFLCSWLLTACSEPVFARARSPSPSAALWAMACYVSTGSAHNESNFGTVKTWLLLRRVRLRIDTKFALVCFPVEGGSSAASSCCVPLPRDVQ